MRASISVEGSDPRRCLSAAALRAGVQRWLARSGALRKPALDALAVTVDAASEDPGFTVRRRGDVVAQRRFAVLPERCADRVDAVALAIGLALEHLASGRAGDTPSAPANAAQAGATEAASATSTEPANAAQAGATPPAATATGSRAQPPSTGAEPAVPETEAHDDDDDDDVHVRVHAAAALLAEVLPRPVLAFGAGADVALEGAQLTFTLLATPVQDGTLGTGRTEMRLFAANLRACALAPAAFLELEGCAGVAAGAAVASGHGFADDADATMGWLAPGVRAALRYPRTGLISLRLAFDGSLNAVRPRLILGRADQTEGAGLLGGAAGLELSVALP